jgi:chorismate mutase
MEDQLQTLRTQIDSIDADLITLFAERFKATEQVGLLKSKNGLPAQDLAREAAQFEKIKTLANSAELDPKAARAIWRTIIDEVIKRHTQIRESTTNE